MKDLYNEVHEEMILELLDKNPNMNWSEAVDKTAEAAMEEANDRLAEIADRYRDRMKEGW